MEQLYIEALLIHWHSGLKFSSENRNPRIPEIGLKNWPIHPYLCVIVCYSSVKNSSSAKKAHIFRLLKLGYICWGSPDEHFAVGPKRSGRKTTEIYGVELTNLQA